MAHDAEQAERSAGLRVSASTANGTKIVPARTPSRSPARRPPLAADLDKLHRKARAALVQGLPVDEPMRLVIAGLGWSAIIATDVRAFVFKTGAKSGAPFGYRLKAFEYESVLRVDLRETARGGVAVIHAPLKISVCPSYWADPRDDPWKARNAIPVDLEVAALADEVEVLAGLVSEFQHRGAVRRSLGAAEQRKAAADPTPSVLDRIAELERRGLGV